VIRLERLRLPGVSSSIEWPGMGMGCLVALREESTLRDVPRRPVWIQETWLPLIKGPCGNDVDVYVYVRALSAAVLWYIASFDQKYTERPTEINKGYSSFYRAHQ